MATHLEDPKWDEVEIKLNSIPPCGHVGNIRVFYFDKNRKTLCAHFGAIPMLEKLLGIKCDVTASHIIPRTPCLMMRQEPVMLHRLQRLKHALKLAEECRCDLCQSILKAEIDLCEIELREEKDLHESHTRQPVSSR